MARLLAASAGWVDAAGYVALFRLFTAHQSGNTSGFAVAIAGGDWAMAWRRGLSIGTYLFGVGLGALLVEQCRRRWPQWSGTVVSVAELVALAAALGIGELATGARALAPADTAPYAAAVASLAGAMGLQGVNLRQVRGRTVRTTFVTGMFINMMETFVAAWHTGRGDERHALLGIAGLLGSVSLAFFAGAVAGAAAERSWGFAALGVPIAVVAAIAVWELRIGFEPSLPDQATPDLSQ